MKSLCSSISLSLRISDGSVPEDWSLVLSPVRYGMNPSKNDLSNDFDVDGDIVVVVDGPD